MQVISPAAAKRGRILYIFEAMLEYLISLLVVDSFLATLTKELGFSDSLTGILSSFVSLGCLFQLFSVAIRPRKAKGLVLTLSIVNQLLFMMLYVVPFFSVRQEVKIVLFIVFIFLAYLIYYTIWPKKINWFMALVDDRSRGNFTANKEIVSLLSGMTFSFVMGTVSDHYAAMGKTHHAFAIMAIVIFVLMVLHSLCMIFTVEKVSEQASKRKLSECIKSVLHNKNVLRVTLIFALYQMAIGVCTPFYGTYLISELNFNLQFVSLLVIISSIARVFVSNFWGRYADKNTYVRMVEKCFMVMTMAFICAALAVPANGKIMFALYYILFAIAMGGISNAITSMVFDYVPYEERSDAIAVSRAFSGVAGFLCTIVASRLVAAIQESGNAFFGITVYAQQVVSIIGALLLIITILYVRKVGKANEHNPS